jgi:hypothetical protein
MPSAIFKGGIDLTGVPTPRDALLLSHANPEDNEFTLSLALQLSKEGC